MNMESNVNPPPLPSVDRRAPTPVRDAVLTKAAVIAALAVVMMIPLALIQGTLTERRGRKAEAIGDISRSWGAEQTVVGPVLVVPYTYEVVETVNQRVESRTEVVEKRRTERARLYVLPSSLTVDGSLDPKTLYRGIYETAVYAGSLVMEGRFDPPDLTGLPVQADALRWDEAEVTIAVTDLRGAREAMVVESGDAKIPLLPGSALPGFDSGVRARVGTVAAAGRAWPFRIAVTMNGSRSLRIVPAGASTAMRLASVWPDPSFAGAFLPVERSVTPSGFTAEWRVSQYGRTFPSIWTDAKGQLAPTADKFDASSFGVSLLSLVDTYRTVERSIKYGILFVALVFTAFFLFEILAALRIHPLQYILVGAALSLFYLALLSLSEFIPFGAAYAAAAAASLALISGYCVKVLRGGRRTGLLAVALALAYGAIYMLLQLQDYALLLGTAILFATLGGVMYATRNIDWYSAGRR